MANSSGRNGRRANLSFWRQRRKNRAASAIVKMPGADVCIVAAGIEPGLSIASTS